MKTRWLLQALVLVALVAAGMSTIGTPASAAPFCGITWGSAAKQAGSLRPAPLVDARTAQHKCYDRTVFEFRGKANGYRVSYVKAVPEEGTGEALPVAGGAKIWVQLYNPAYDSRGHSTYPHRSRDHVADVTGYRTLRDLVYGGSFEGYTTFGLGVRAKLPFRAFVLAGPGGHSRIVVDVAHKW